VIIKTSDGSTKLLRKHFKVHPHEKKMFKKLEEGVATQSMDNFLIREKSGWCLCS